MTQKMITSDTQSYRKGQVIFRQGDREYWMYDILEGSVGIYTDYGTPAEKELVILCQGQFFGEMSLIEHMPRSASAVALKNDTKLCRINASDFDEYFADKPGKLMEIMQQMSVRIRELTELYLEACRTLHDTAETEADEERRSGLRERFRACMKDYLVLSSIPYDRGSYSPQTDILGYRREWRNSMNAGGKQINEYR